MRWFSDGQNACKIIQVGSTKSDLHFIAMEIFQLCVDYIIALEDHWITRSEIDRADYISRIIETPAEGRGGGVVHKITQVY